MEKEKLSINYRFLKGENPNETNKSESNKVVEEKNSDLELKEENNSTLSSQPNSSLDEKNIDKDENISGSTINPTGNPIGTPVGPSKPTGSTPPPSSIPPKIPKKKQSTLSKILWIAVIVLLFLLIFAIIFGVNTAYVSYDEFYRTLSEASNAGKVQVNIDINDGNYVMASFVYNNTMYITYFDDITQLTTVTINFMAVYPTANVDQISWSITNPQPSFLLYLILTWLPWLFFFVIAWVIIKMVIDKQQTTGKIQKKSLTPQISSVTFNDVEGYMEIKQELAEIVDFLKNAAKYSAVGARTPKGVLLSGPPELEKHYLPKQLLVNQKFLLFYFRFWLCRNVCWSWCFKSKIIIWTS